MHRDNTAELPILKIGINTYFTSGYCRNFIEMGNCKFFFSGIRQKCYTGIVTGAVLTIFLDQPISARSQELGNTISIDTAFVNHQIKVAEDLQDPDSAILLYKKLLQQSIDINYPDGAYNALMQMSVLYREKDDYQQAQAILQQALGWAPKARRKDAFAWCYNNLGDIFESQGDYTKAAAYFYKALDEIKKVPGPSITAANINISLGYLYKLLGQPQKAMAFYNEAERISIAGHYDYQLTGVYINKGAYYIDTHQPDSAKQYFTRVMALASQQNLPDLVAMGNSGMGASMVAAGAYKQAVPYLQTAISISKRNFPEIARDASYILGDALLHLHKYKDAEAILVAALKETKSVNTRYNYIEAYTKLVEVYKATGQYRKAMDYMDSVAVLRDSIMSSETNAINRMEIKYQTAEKDKELAQNQLLIAKQENKLQQKNLLIASIIASIILVSLLLLLRYIKSQNKKHLQAEQIKALQRENTISILRGVVQGEEKERERLARELHDGIGGMLSAAMLRFMAMRHDNQTIVMTRAYREGMNMLDEMGDEIRKASHNLMPSVLLMQSLPEAVSSYCRSVQDGSKLQIDFQYYGDFDQLNQDFKLNVYRIIQELLKNIVAHAHATHALVQLTVNDNILSLTVEDNGVGFAKDEATNGIGLHNMHTRVSVLHGHCTIESEPLKGTSVFIEFNLAMAPKTMAHEN